MTNQPKSSVSAEPAKNLTVKPQALKIKLSQPKTSIGAHPMPCTSMVW